MFFLKVQLSAVMRSLIIWFKKIPSVCKYVPVLQKTDLNKHGGENSSRRYGIWCTGLTGVFRIIRCTRNTDIFRGSLFHMSDNDPDWKFHVSRGVKIP